MPALDYNNKTADTTHDISAAATKSTAAVEMARAGLVKGLKCVVFITEASAQDFSTNKARAYFEYSTDNGSTYHRAGVGEFKLGASGVLNLQRIEFPVDLDIVPEQNAEGDIQWRVTTDIGSTIANADDFNFQAYLGAGVGAKGTVD